jgi:hypothetical protein
MAHSKLLGVDKGVLNHFLNWLSRVRGGSIQALGGRGT